MTLGLRQVQVSLNKQILFCYSFFKDSPIESAYLSVGQGDLKLNATVEWIIKAFQMQTRMALGSTILSVIFDIAVSFLEENGMAVQFKSGCFSILQ